MKWKFFIKHKPTDEWSRGRRTKRNETYEKNSPLNFPHACSSWSWKFKLMCFLLLAHLSLAEMVLACRCGWLMHVLCSSGSFNLILKASLLGFPSELLPWINWILMSWRFCFPTSTNVLPCKCPHPPDPYQSLFSRLLLLINPRTTLYGNSKWILRQWELIPIFSRHIFAHCGALSDDDSKWITRKTRRRWIPARCDYRFRMISQDETAWTLPTISHCLF